MILSLIALCIGLATPAQASDTNNAPEDASIVASHGSPTGEMIPQPVMPKEMKNKEELPFPISLIMRPLERGMLVRLPIIDTDPNRGFSFGVLPVWILNSSNGDRIISMHAPSIIYNPIFKTNVTYRYFYYPTPDSSLQLRGSMAQVAEKEFFAQYDNSNLFNKLGEAGLKLQYNIDASNRFFGIGPATNRNAQANYALKTGTWDAYFGLPLYQGSNWYWTAEHRLIGNAVADGPVHTVPGITTLYPNAVPAHYHQDSALRAYLTYDTLDNSVTTTSGTYAEFFAESSQKSLASEYTFQRYSVDLRHFYRAGGDDTFVTAARYKLEQVTGDGVPFWLMPYLGGKYTFPAYGDGRYTNLGVMAAVIEERIAVLRLKQSGVLMRFEVAPFVGLGSSFDTPGHMTSRYARPVFGTGLRAVAPPQVVGSIDIGIGQEGMAAFMDINYPF